MAVSTNTALIQVGSWTLLTVVAGAGAVIRTSTGPIKIAYATSPPATFDGVPLYAKDPLFLFPGLGSANIYATAIGLPARVDWITTA